MEVRLSGQLPCSSHVKANYFSEDVTMRRIIPMIVVGVAFLAGLLTACSSTSNHANPTGSIPTKLFIQTAPAVQDAVVAKLQSLGYRLADLNGFASSVESRVISDPTWWKSGAPTIHITDAFPATAGRYRIDTVDF